VTMTGDHNADEPGHAHDGDVSDAVQSKAARLPAAIHTGSALIANATPSRIGLALGGGGARGIAHVAILEAFDELGLKPTIIAGTSIGAIFGAAYASGLSATQIRELTLETLTDRVALIRQLFSARSLPIGRLFRVLPRRTALLDPAAVLELVLASRVAKRFEDLQIPLRIAATDISTHQGVVLEDGDLRTAIAASISIPVLFSPVARDPHVLLDGGLVNPCPYDLLGDQSDLCVAIDVSGAASEAAIGPEPSAIEVMVQSTQILQKSITRERLKFSPPDLYLDVDLDRFGALEFYKAREILEAAEPIKADFKARLARLVSSDAIAVT